MRRDSGSSFVILLTVVALEIGIWALISVPAESSHALGLQNAFLHMKVSEDKVRVNNFERAQFSMLMPGGAGMSGTKISFTEDTGGLLSLEWNRISEKKRGIQLVASPLRLAGHGVQR